MIRQIVFFLVFLLAGSVKAENMTRDVWHLYLKGEAHIIAIYKQNNQPKRISFEFNFESEDGYTFIATIRGHSVGDLVPVPNTKGCFYARMFEHFESTENDFIVCDADDRVLLANMDAESTEALPKYLIFDKTVDHPIK